MQSQLLFKCRYFRRVFSSHFTDRQTGLDEAEKLLQTCGDPCHRHPTLQNTSQKFNEADERKVGVESGKCSCAKDTARCTCVVLLW